MNLLSSIEEYMYGVNYSAELRYILFHLINNAFPSVTKNSVMKRESKEVITSGKIPERNWLGLSDLRQLTVSNIQNQHEKCLHIWKDELLRTMRSIKLPVSPLDVLLNEDRRAPAAEVSERRIRVMRHYAGNTSHSAQESDAHQSSSEHATNDDQDYFYVEKRGETVKDMDQVNQREWKAFQRGEKRILVLSQTSNFLLPTLDIPEDVGLLHFINRRRSLIQCLQRQMMISKQRRCMRSGYTRVARMEPSIY